MVDDGQIADSREILAMGEKWRVDIVFADLLCLPVTVARAQGIRISRWGETYRVLA